MRWRSGRALGAALILLLVPTLPLQAQQTPGNTSDGTDGEASAGEPLVGAVERGRYVFQAAGCLGCHTDEEGGGAPLAGGRALATPFGTFYTPNITPDPETGIGAWSEADLTEALRHGTAPDGDAYYPAFPYPSYTGMTDADIGDLYVYLMAQPPVRSENRRHALDFPYNLRFALGLWQWLYLEPGAFEPDPAKDAAWNRGAYLVRHLTHCGECHSPRGWLGAVDHARDLTGSPAGPDGDRVPGLIEDLADWSESDIAYALKIGMTPEGDFLSDAMGEVIENSTSHLSDSDLSAISKYLKDLPAVGAP